jgi:HD-GYP domain-containing protein (c-di-GMP phosphodiesterase class II)
MLMNYLFGSAFAVFGVGSTLIFYTLPLSADEITLLLFILGISVAMMISCEFFVYRRQLEPIKRVYMEGEISYSTLQHAYIRAQQLPVLTLKRILGPHFLGLSIPASLLAFLFMTLEKLNMPYYFIGYAWLGAFLVALMHALIEFFLTSHTVQPLFDDLHAQSRTHHQASLSTDKTFFLSLQRKMLVSSLFLAIFPVLLFSLAVQIRLQEQHVAVLQDYWSWAGIILLVILMMALSASYLLFKNIQRPMGKLQSALYHVQNGQMHMLENHYSDEFSQLITGYNHMVTAIKERDDVNQQLLESFFTVFAATLDARDHYTAGHSIRVAEYAVQIGKHAGFNNDQLDLLKKSALLHDIGKIGVKDAVLLKDGRLTDEEFEQIKLHPVIGAHLLEQVHLTADMEALLPGVKYHHERYDGKGYPEGLKGQNIPLFGRVIAVADAYDAMTSDRPYRKGMPVQKALSIIEEGKGTQWDPYFAELFIQLMNDQHADVPTARASSS